MINLIVRICNQVHPIQKEQEKKRYMNCIGVTSIACNILLFLVKFIMASMSNSVAILADAVNNLSDAGTSFVSYIGLHLANRPADDKHPFGHARYEYIVSIIVAFLIVLLGFELIQSSIYNILHPNQVVFHWLTLIVLLLSISVKLWLYCMQKYYGKKFNSSILIANAMDCLSDCLATSAVFISMIVSHYFQLQLDGYMGIVVSIFILIASYKIIMEMLDGLLGKAPSKEKVNEISDFILCYDGVLGIHDLMVHDYGGDHCFASVHVEVSCEEDILKSHDMIDQIERDIQEQLDIQLVIHMDPINTWDEDTIRMKEYIQEIIQNINKDLSIHDFRIVKGISHSNLIFDCLIPNHVHIKNEKILQEVKEEVAKLQHKYYVVIRFDRAYISDVSQ